MRTILAKSLVLYAVAGFGCGCSSPPGPGGHNGPGGGPHPGPGSGTTASADSLPELPADSREPILGQATTELLSSQHVLHRPVDDTVSEEAFPKYIEALDGAKLVLLQPDVDALAAYHDK